MTLRGKRPQMSGRPEPAGKAKGEARSETRGVEEPMAENRTERSATRDLLERVLERSNLQEALKRVKKNKGSPGIDGMTVGQLPGHLKAHWTEIREQILTNKYQPSMVRRHEIPKSGGGVRQLGIPTVLDRMIQQALLQVMQPIFDPSFSPSSYGFRPGRSALDAVKASKQYVEQGRRYVVDVDLSKFFDRVNHDILMGRLAKRIEDKRVLTLIRRYLEAGMMAGGVVIERREGTPQGGPLSPLLANILLDEVDKELEKRGHAFARYADDCNVYVRSRRAGGRVMTLLRKLFAKLRLVVNEEKSAVDRVWYRDFLGYGLWWNRHGKVQHRVSRKALQAFKTRVRETTSRTRGRSMSHVAEELRSYLLGWKGYFQLSQTRLVFRELDKWIRHRLRAYQLHLWRRGPVIHRELLARGVPPDVAAKVAANSRRWWRNAQYVANIAFPNRYFIELGIPQLE